MLIDTDGTVLDSANGGMPGEFDLIAALPAIADLEQDRAGPGGRRRDGDGHTAGRPTHDRPNPGSHHP